MTVIVWDGTTLAADKLAVNGGCAFRVTKIFRIDADRLAGIAGHLGRGMLVLDWLRRAGTAAEYPGSVKDDDWCSVMVVHRSGVIHLYESVGAPFAVDGYRHAIGSGRDFARAALWYGANALEAVRVASELSVDCGKGMNALTFEEDK